MRRVTDDDRRRQTPATVTSLAHLHLCVGGTVKNIRNSSPDYRWRFAKIGVNKYETKGKAYVNVLRKGDHIYVPESMLANL